MNGKLIPITVALLTTLSLSVQAADTPPSAKDKPAKSEQPRTMKPHSHLDEKGIPHSDPDKSKPKSQKKKDSSKHDHQRDAK